MTTPPYARLGVRVNGAAPQYGGITVAHGDMVQFVAESTAYWGTPAAVWQIFDYPDGWTGPGAPWVSTTIPQANGLPDAVVFQYTGNTAPPPFVMPALPYWGKFMPSLFVNGGTIQGVAAPQLYDESTAIQILSPNALVDTAFRETSQYGSWRGFAGVLKALVRLIDTLFSAVPALSNATPQAIGTAAAGVGTASSRDDHVHAHGNQASNGSFHAAAIASGAAGFMPGADKAKLDNAATVATVSTLVLRDAAGRAQVADPSANADIDTKGARDTAIAAAHSSTLLLISGTAAIPATAKTVRVTCQAPGGGGGGGATRGAGVAVGGGGGGGGGGYSQHTYDASRLLVYGSTLTVTIGAAGSGGAGATSPDTDGTAGTSAGDVTVEIGATLIIAAGGGDGGVGGTVGTGGTGGGGGDGFDVGSTGATGSIGGAGPSAPSAPLLAGAGGGGGGGISAGDSAGSGGNGGGIPVWRGGTGTGGAGGGVGVAGSIGTDVVAYPLGGGGGGGGGGNAAGNGGAGGAGGISGGGGGGGGAARNGSRAGAGDNGRAGSVLIEIW